MVQDTTILDNVVEFYERYYRDEIAELAQSYPKDSESLWIEHRKVNQYDVDLADDLQTHPQKMLEYFEEAVDMVELPVDISFSDVTVRVSGLNENHVYTPGEIRSDQATHYVGISGVLERVTTSNDLPNVLVFDCLRCDQQNPVEQEKTQREIQEPHVCQHCEKQGPFEINHEASDWSDYAKLRVESPPDATEAESGQLVGFAIDDLIDKGGETGLIGRAGEPVTVYGIVRRVQKTGRGENELLFDHMLEARDVVFEKDDNTVVIEDHKDEFIELANQPDAIDLFAESIAPQLHETDAWESAMEFAVAYLFGAPRIDLPDGPTYRGDLHFLILSDFGMGKSTFKKEIEMYSPKCISKSTTALSSGVGLTAAAVKDDFGEGQWTIKPGLLVRANGGHLILDEIDKGPDELTEMNDALEGEQVVDIEKAGKSATYDSKTGLMALGNPVDGRFDPNISISEQLGISETLLSRFDGIVTMEDTVDEEQDQLIAETYGKSYTEAQQTEYGSRESFDQLNRPVPIDTGQAWVKYAREEINPILTYDQFKELEDWYATEVRQLNQKFAQEGDGEDMPVPATVRQLAAAVKMSIAFARARLQDEVKQPQIERAKKLGKKLVKQNWNGESFDVTKNKKQNSQYERIQRIRRECGGEVMTASDVSESMRISYDVTRSTLKTMASNNDADEVAKNTYEIKELV